jgi:hypothetical protein
MTRPPDFDELVGNDLSPDERARLLRVHNLLIAAGPPPELSPELETPPAPEAQVIPIPRRRWRTAGLLAAAVVLIAFGAGWLIGDATRSDHIQRTVAMTGASGAHADLEILDVDDAGNWPMKMIVTGLKPLSGTHTYALWLTKHGKLDSPCGTFTVASGSGSTTVRLNAPYKLKEYTGWVVVVSGRKQPILRTTQV